MEDCYQEVGEVKKESKKILEKIIATQLNPNERKKVTSKKLGKWLSMSDDNLIIGIVCTQEDYPERLAYKMINECSEKLIEIYGEDEYYKQSNSALKSAFEDGFMA